MNIHLYFLVLANSRPAGTPMKAMSTLKGVRAWPLTVALTPCTFCMKSG